MNALSVASIGNEYTDDFNICESIEQNHSSLSQL